MVKNEGGGQGEGGGEYVGGGYVGGSSTPVKSDGFFQRYPWVIPVVVGVSVCAIILVVWLVRR